VKKIFTKIFSISMGLILLGFVAAEGLDWRQHILFLRTLATAVFLTLSLGLLAKRTGLLLPFAALFVAIAMVSGTCYAESQNTVAGLLTRSLRAYEANRPMEAEELWRQARIVEPKIARPPWLTPGQELPANLIAQSTENTGYSLWGLFIRLLTLPVLLALLIWQAWRAIHDIRESVEAKSKQSVSQSQSCPECIRLSQEHHKLQRKFELLQKSAAGSQNDV
jgi:hypothetical protein